jgi:hypothetical protein
MPTFPPTELLGAHNYGTWAEEVEAYCMTQQGSDIWLAINPDTEVPTTNAKLAEWKKHNLFVYGTIFCAVHPDHRDILRDITPAKCSHTAWAALHAHHIRDTPSYRLRFCKFFNSLSYFPTIGITGYSNSLKRVVHDFLNISHILSWVEVFDKLLIGLPSFFSSIHTTLCGKYNDKKFLLKDAIAELLKFERREGLTPPDQVPSLPSTLSTSTVMHASYPATTHIIYKTFCWLNTENHESVCFRCGRSGHSAARCVHDMPKEVKDKVLGITTSRAATGDIYYADAAPSDDSILGISTLNMDNLESLETGHVAHLANHTHSVSRSQFRFHSRSPAFCSGRHRFSSLSMRPNLIIGSPDWLTAEWIADHPEWNNSYD